MVYSDVYQNSDCRKTYRILSIIFFFLIRKKRNVVVYCVPVQVLRRSVHEDDVDDVVADVSLTFNLSSKEY